MSQLATILENFCRLDGVQGALVMESDGGVTEERFAEDGASAPLAEVVRRSQDAGLRLTEVLEKAPLTQQYIEFADRQITAETLEGGRTLVIVADSGANLGRIRLEIRKNKKNVEAALA